MFLQAGWQAAVCDQLPLQSLGQAILSNDGEAGGLSAAGARADLPNETPCLLTRSPDNAQTYAWPSDLHQLPTPSLTVLRCAA